MKDLVISWSIGIKVKVNQVTNIVIVTAATPKKRLPLFHLKKIAILRLGASVFRRGRAIMRTGSGGSLPLWTSKVTVRSGRSADGQLLHAHTQLTRLQWANRSQNRPLNKRWPFLPRLCPIPIDLLECAMMTSCVRKFSHCPILGAICSPMVQCCRGDLCSSWCCLLLRELWTEGPPLVAPHYGSIQGDGSSSSSFSTKHIHRL